MNCERKSKDFPKIGSVNIKLKSNMKNNEESRLQKNAISWFRLQYPKLTIYAIPNGGRRGKIEAAIMKGEGVLAGVADVFISKPSGSYCGLYIEFKTATGRQSTAQKEFENNATRDGYKYVVCRSLEQFIDEANKYLRI